MQAGIIDTRGPMPGWRALLSDGLQGASFVALVLFLCWMRY